MTQENSLPHALGRWNGFSESNLLGVGSVGPVYKGALLDGTVVAVRVFNMLFEGALKKFWC